MRAMLLDCDYKTKNGKSIIQLYVRTEKGIEKFEDQAFQPYFYVILDSEKSAKNLQNFTFEGGFKALKVEKAERKNAEHAFKLLFESTEQVVQARDQVRDVEGVLEKREFDIPFAKRYLIDKQLEPCNGVRMDVNGSQIQQIDKAEISTKLKMAAFDLETRSRHGIFSNPEQDEILLIAYSNEKEDIVWSCNPSMKGIAHVKIVQNEKEMLEKFVEKLKKDDLDVVITYNGDRFDFPYVKTRCKKYKISFDINADGSEPGLQRKGLENAFKTSGIQHVDAFQLVRLLARFQAINLVKYDLESVTEALLGIPKEKVRFEDINRFYDSKEKKKLEKLVEYNRLDAHYTLKLTEQYLELLVELSKLVKQTLYETNRSSASQLVEYLLLNKCFELKVLAPNKPRETEMAERREEGAIEGAFVKEPLPGLHENLAVLDFRSLYPSILISHNISPETLDCAHAECKKGANSAPTGHWFCAKEKGFLPQVIQEILEKRSVLKKAAKAAKKGSVEEKQLHARQWSLKILLNSFYGTLLFSRFRWYSRECGRAITAWGREYVQNIGKKIEENDFTLIYQDTDSAFLGIPKNKSQEDVEALVEKVNEKLPGVMELELEGFYKRGIFVTKKEGGAAKKRYALIDYKGNLKIVGFEYVRRDWSEIAKQTQKNVIQAVLEEGKPEKAIQIVRDAIAGLRSGKMPNKELVVFTQIQKKLDKYEIVNPSVAAAKKAIARGQMIGEGSIVGFIITKNGKSISDKAELEEFVKEGNYDSDYYIQNQVIPAVIKIMRELGYSETDLLEGGKQTGLGSF